MSTCTRCNGPLVLVELPPAYRGLLAGDPPAIGVCRRCLYCQPASSGSSAFDELQDISSALPRSPSATLGLIILVTLCESLATNRAEIERLIPIIEGKGQDPLLALDRLADDPDLAKHVDLDSRRRQLEQLL